MAPNDLTPCRMAFYFVSTFAIAQTPTKQPALRLSRTKNLHFAKAPFPGFSADELKTKENRPKYVFYACALVGGLIYFVLTIDLSQIDYISNDIRTKVNYISEDITAKMNVNAINDTNDSSAVTIKPGVYYVKVNVLEERLAPSSTASITNRIYRKQKLDVYEVRNGWARVSKFYDGSVEGKTGQVARWVNTQGLSAYQ